MKYIEMLLTMSRTSLLKFANDMQMPDMKLMSRRQIATEIDRRMRNGKIGDMIYCLESNDIKLFQKVMSESYCYKAANETETNLLDSYCRNMMMNHDIQKKGYIVPEEVSQRMRALQQKSTFSGIQRKRNWILSSINACIRIYHVFSINELLQVCNQNLLPVLNAKELSSEIGHIPPLFYHASYRNYLFIDSSIDHSELTELIKAVNNQTLNYAFPEVREVYDMHNSGYPVSEAYVRDFTEALKKYSGLQDVSSIVRDCWNAINMNRDNQAKKIISKYCGTYTYMDKELQIFTSNVRRAYLKGNPAITERKIVHYEGTIILQNDDNKNISLMERDPLIQKLITY